MQCISHNFRKPIIQQSGGEWGNKHSGRNKPPHTLLFGSAQTIKQPCCKQKRDVGKQLPNPSKWSLFNHTDKVIKRQLTIFHCGWLCTSCACIFKKMVIRDTKKYLPLSYCHRYKPSFITDTNWFAEDFGFTILKDSGSPLHSIRAHFIYFYLYPGDKNACKLMSFTTQAHDVG